VADRAGLKKKVSAIFDGPPQTGREPESGPLKGWQLQPPEGERRAPGVGSVRTLPSGTLRGIGTAVRKRLFPEGNCPEAGRQRLLAVVLLVLFVALVAVLARNLSGISGRSAANGLADDKVADLPSDVMINWPVPEPYPETLRDPMSFDRGRSQGRLAGTRRLALTGILYSRRKPSAVVDGVIVREGDTVDGVKVVKIYKSSVEFEAAGESWTQKVSRPASAARTGEKRL
jgi:hypothetical protein